jgi:hypothetical protein
MQLKIIWRNPEWVSHSRTKLERLVRDEYGSLFVVRRDGEIRTLELLSGGAA